MATETTMTVMTTLPTMTLRMLLVRLSADDRPVARRLEAAAVAALKNRIDA